MNNKEVILEAKNVHRHFLKGDKEVLKNISLKILKKDALCITGNSGVGKSTFLNILGTLDRPTQGEVFYRKKNLLLLSNKELARFRNQKMGFIFQFHYLMPEFTVLENVMVPGQIAKKNYKECRKRAKELIELLDLKPNENHFPSELSGGEQQRVGIARALMNEPEILIADEPSGNLDAHNTMNVINIFLELREKFDLTLVVASHDLQFSKAFPKVVNMRDGTFVI